jgi:hypothetical protein
MQKLDRGHFLAAFGDLDSIPDQDQPTVDVHRTWEQSQHRLRPQSRKPIQFDPATVKVFAQCVVKCWL